MPTSIDRDNVQKLIAEGAQLVEVLPRTYQARLISRRVSNSPGRA